jgi:DNA invertase Pin-like site-specific DNA recombinase
LAAQERDLLATGADKVFTEQVSSVGRRDRLEAALDFVREGDVLLVTRPDRLARSTADLLGIVARLDAKRVGLVVLSMGGQPLDTRTATGTMMLTVLAAVATFERHLMLERQREGIAKAKPRGGIRGGSRRPDGRPLRHGGFGPRG